MAEVNGATFGRFISEVLMERFRQERLASEGKLSPKRPCSDPSLSHAERLGVLGEEFGEVAKATNEGELANLREELIQVAAVAVAWVEAIDAKAVPGG